MKTFIGNIEEKTRANTCFREVVYTGQHAQLVLMSLQPLEEIGMETHATVDQFFRIEDGEGKVIMNGEESLVGDGDALVIPAGTQHNVINTSAEKPMKMYTIYSPPHHKDGIVHKTKAEAEADTTDHL